MTAPSRYLVALGSNRRHPEFGSPRGVARAAMEELAALGTVRARSPVIATDPVGPARRRFANAAAILESEYDPEALLAGLKHIERGFGRTDGGQRWGDRVLDLDIVLWSGGAWASDALVIPHPAFRQRAFVLAPAVAIAADWRDPITRLTLRQLHFRLAKPHSA